MAAERPFPPSARRRALSRAAGLHAASPVLVGALACAAAVIVLLTLGRSATERLGAWVRTACEVSARSPAVDAGVSSPPAARPASHPTSLSDDATIVDGATSASGVPVPSAAASLELRDLPFAILELVVPVLVVIALAALVAHLAQTRAVWLPRRRVDGAPVPAPHRVRRTGLDLLGASAIACVTLGWLWWQADRLATLVVTPLVGALVLASFLGAIAIAWTVLGVGDALVRHAELAAAMHMTPAEKREDERLAGADPRWRKHREQLARDDRARRAHRARRRGREDAPTLDLRDAVAGASVLVLGDDVAVAIAWDPVLRPVPVRTATGHGPRATQLLALARRHAVPVHRDPSLATALATADGAVPEAHWPRLADIVAATRPPKGDGPPMFRFQ